MLKTKQTNKISIMSDNPDTSFRFRPSDSDLTSFKNQCWPTKLYSDPPSINASLTLCSLSLYCVSHCTTFNGCQQTLANVGQFHEAISQRHIKYI